MTAQEAAEISKHNDLSSVYTLISNAAHKGEYMVKVKDISAENINVLAMQGYKVELIDDYDLLERIVGKHVKISWRDA